MSPHADPGDDGRVSVRGFIASTSDVRPDRQLFFEATQNLYDETDNPAGALPMNVAENTLGWNALKSKIEDVSRQIPLPDWVAGYTRPRGHPEVLATVTGFMSRHLGGCDLDPDWLSLTAGASSAIDLAAYILGDEGDVVIIPAPSYPVYTHDVHARSGLQRYDLITHHEPGEIADGPLLTPLHLDAALAEITNEGKRLSLVLLTTPDNPTGGVYSFERLQQISAWCMEHHVHLLVNEIYGLSLIDTGHPELGDDYVTDVRFTSFLRIIEQQRSDYLHHCYAFSKDFGLSGFRLGLLYSRNTEFVAAVGNLNISQTASNHTQWIIQQVLEDHDFVQDFVDDNRVKLTKAYVSVVRVLRRSAIPYVPSRGSLFVWADLSEFMTSDSDEAEHDLWLDIYENTGVLLTSGAGFGHTKNGMFRFVYPGLLPEELHVAMNRLEAYFAHRRNQ